MTRAASYRVILRASAIMGSASVLNILFGIIRMKVAAVLLGPAGVGLIGLLQNIMATVSTASGLGLDTAGTRQIAESRESAGETDVVRRILFISSLSFAALGGGIFWLFGNHIAAMLFSQETQIENLNWLAIGIALMVLSMGQVAVLNGLRKIESLALVKIASSTAASVIGIAALLLLGNDGIMIFVLGLPLSTFTISFILVRRLGRPQPINRPIGAMLRQWVQITRLGSTFMFGALITIVGQLIVRASVQNELGATSLGYFEAAWMISMTYIGFVLGAMATDYYPRLTATINDKPAAVQLVNEQTEVALYLVGPMLVLTLAIAPLVITVLYSAEFSSAAEILRLQIFGDLLKVISWPLGFILLSAGMGKTYMGSEAFGMAVFTVSTWLLLPWIGVNATGAGFFLMYLFYLPVTYLIAWRRLNFRWSSNNKKQFSYLAACLGVVYASLQISELWGSVLGVLISAGLGYQAWSYLRRASKTPTP